MRSEILAMLGDAVLACALQQAADNVGVGIITIGQDSCIWNFLCEQVFIQDCLGNMYQQYHTSVLIQGMVLSKQPRNGICQPCAY